MIRFGCQALLQHFLKKLYFLHFVLDKSKKHWYNKLCLGAAIVYMYI